MLALIASLAADTAVVEAIARGRGGLRPVRRGSGAAMRRIVA